jgi:hypothetical protein
MHILCYLSGMEPWEFPLVGSDLLAHVECRRLNSCVLTWSWRGVRWGGHCAPPPPVSGGQIMQIEMFNCYRTPMLVEVLRERFESCCCCEIYEKSPVECTLSYLMTYTSIRNFGWFAVTFLVGKRQVDHWIYNWYKNIYNWHSANDLNFYHLNYDELILLVKYHADSSNLM